MFEGRVVGYLEEGYMSKASSFVIKIRPLKSLLKGTIKSVTLYFFKAKIIVFFFKSSNGQKIIVKCMFTTIKPLTMMNQIGQLMIR